MAGGARASIVVRASGVPASGSTQKPVASVGASPLSGPQGLLRDVTLGDETRGRTERLRVLISNNLQSGDRRHIATILGLRPESISRQLSGVERLAEEFVALAQHFLSMSLEPGSETLNEIRELRCLGFESAPIRIVLDPRTGACEWSYIRP